MMDITIGISFISLGAGNGVGPPPHSGTETQDTITEHSGEGKGVKQ